MAAGAGRLGTLRSTAAQSPPGRVGAVRCRRTGRGRVGARRPAIVARHHAQRHCKSAAMPRPGIPGPRPGRKAGPRGQMPGFRLPGHRRWHNSGQPGWGSRLPGSRSSSVSRVGLCPRLSTCARPDVVLLVVPPARWSAEATSLLDPVAMQLRRDPDQLSGRLLISRLERKVIQAVHRVCDSPAGNSATAAQAWASGSAGCRTWPRPSRSRQVEPGNLCTRDHRTSSNCTAGAADVSCGEETGT